MITDNFTNALKLLNEAFAADPVAIQALLEYRVPCNKALADHPTIQVLEIPTPDGEKYSIGLLGIINATVAPNYGELIASCWSDEGAHGIPQLTGFVQYLRAEAAS